MVLGKSGLVFFSLSAEGEAVGFLLLGPRELDRQTRALSAHVFLLLGRHLLVVIADDAGDE
jgi:hypothetical protein